MIWTLYTDDLIENASLLCMEGSDLWLTVVLIHCFAIEVYCPDRVMHQFGLHRHIPNDIDTFDDMHIVNR